MNTKIITFCVFATIFMAAVVGLCQLHQTCMARLSIVLVFMFILAALACAVVEILRLLKDEQLLESKKTLQSEILSLEQEIVKKQQDLAEAETKYAETGADRIKDLEKKNAELQTMLSKLADTIQYKTRVALLSATL